MGCHRDTETAPCFGLDYHIKSETFVKGFTVVDKYVFDLFLIVNKFDNIHLDTGT